MLACSINKSGLPLGDFTVTHEINCNADTSWRLFLDKSLQKRLTGNPLVARRWSPRPMAKARSPRFQWGERASVRSPIVRRPRVA